jgi:hypothetical protein
LARLDGFEPPAGCPRRRSARILSAAPATVNTRVRPTPPGTERARPGPQEHLVRRDLVVVHLEVSQLDGQNQATARLTERWRRCVSSKPSSEVAEPMRRQNRIMMMNGSQPKITPKIELPVGGWRL